MYQLEIQYAQSGSNLTNNEALKINQLRIINNFRYHIIENQWSLNLGLSGDYNLSVKYKDYDLSEGTKTFFVGYGFGTEVSFSRYIGIGASYFSQFSNLLKSDNGNSSDTEFVPTNIQVYLVVRF